MRRRVTMVASLFALGCATSEVLRLDQVTRPARTPEAVQFFLEAPDSAYVAIALIEVSDDGWGLSLETLRQRLASEAARLGGDAVILTRHSEDAATVLMPVGDQFWAVPMEEKGLTGQVIIFQR